MYKNGPPIEKILDGVRPPGRVPSRTYSLGPSSAEAGEVLKITALNNGEPRRELKINENTLVDKLKNLYEKLPVEGVASILAGVTSFVGYVNHKIAGFSPENVYRLNEAAERTANIPLIIKTTAEGAAVGIVVGGVSYLLLKYIPRLVSRKKRKQ